MSLNLERKLHQRKKKEEKPKEVIVFKNLSEHTAWRIEKMLDNPVAAARIPAMPKPAEAPKIKDYNLNTHGSSAGAGSGEFHVYRQDREREYNRQKYLEEQDALLKSKSEFEGVKSEHQKADEARLAKHRAKRMKRKQAKRKKLEGSEGATQEKGERKLLNKDAVEDDKDEEDEDEDEEEQEEEEPQHFVIGGK